MELLKLTKEEIRAFDATKARDAEQQIRRELVNMRMDIYSEKGKHTAAKKNLRKQLARVLTAKNANVSGAK